MRRIAIYLALFLILGLNAFALDVPEIKEPVTDLAGVLTQDQVAALNSKLQNLKATDSTQLAVLIYSQP
jgi:uncharacterized membrane protein YgcG